MSRRQRNNVAGLSGDLRRIVSKMLFDGATYDEIRSAMAGRISVKLHNNSFKAWQKGQEYIRYRNSREEFETKMADDQLLATVINDGRGPESLTDLIIMDVIRAVREMTRDSEELDMGTLAGITKALSPILRNQVAEAKLDADTRLEKAEAKHAAGTAELQAEIDSLKVENTHLRDILSANSIDPDATGGKADPKAVADEVDRLLGRKK